MTRQACFHPCTGMRKTATVTMISAKSAQLDMIQHMKALGMSLKDIREQMTHFELDMFKTILHRNLEELELRSRELMYQRRAIERTLESYEWYENAPAGRDHCAWNTYPGD